MKKIALLLTFLSLLVAIPVVAQTPSPEEEEATEAAVTVGDELRKEAQEQVQSLKDAAKKRAFWGELVEITNSTLVLENPRAEKIVQTGDTTELFLGKAEIDFEDLEIGNFIIALGYIDEEGNLEAKRVTSYKTAPEPATKRYPIFGDVSDVSEDEEIIALTHPDGEKTYEVEVGTKTTIVKKIEGEIEEIDFEDIKMGDRLVVIGTKEGENDTITARKIHVFSALGEESQEETTPTPTAEPEEETTPTPEEE